MHKVVHGRKGKFFFTQNENGGLLSGKKILVYMVGKVRKVPKREKKRFYRTITKLIDMLSMQLLTTENSPLNSYS